MTDAQVQAQEAIREHPGITIIGRVGWFAKGLVYLVAGILALMVALRSLGWKKGDSGEASPTGAIKEVAHHNLGGPALVILGVGLIIYALWRLISAIMPGSHEMKVVVLRVAYVISAIMYATFAFTAFQVLGESPSDSDGNSKVTDLSRSLMKNGAGRLLLGLVGAALIGAGIYRANMGRKEDVTKELDMSGMSAPRREWTRRLGAIGEIGRAVALLLIGFFLIRAAISYDAAEATGLDGALRRAAENGWSRILVIVVAIGFVCYGVFCLATFTRRRFEAPR